MDRQTDIQRYVWRNLASKNKIHRKSLVSGMAQEKGGPLSSQFSKESISKFGVYISTYTKLIAQFRL